MAVVSEVELLCLFTATMLSSEIALREGLQSAGAEPDFRGLMLHFLRSRYRGLSGCRTGTTHLESSGRNDDEASEIELEEVQQIKYSKNFMLVKYSNCYAFINET